MLVKKDETKNNSLLGHLTKINDHLAQRGTRFLTGDTMCCFDCELMPRLQHIRVAGKYFVDFEIPVSKEVLEVLLIFLFVVELDIHLLARKLKVFRFVCDKPCES